MKIVYLVNKIGCGDLFEFGTHFNNKLVIAEKVKLKKSIKVFKERRSTSENNIAEYYYDKNEEIILVNKVVIGNVKETSDNYFIFENKEEAIDKQLYILDKIKENMLISVEREINRLIEDSKAIVKSHSLTINENL